MIVSMKCPSCGANMDVDDSRDFCFCSFCGYKIVNMSEKVEISGAVKIDNTDRVDGLISRAKRLEEASRYEEAYDCYSQIIEFDATNPTALEGIKRIDGMVTSPNVAVRFVSEESPAAVLRIAVGKMKTVVLNGQSVELKLPIGVNRIVFKGKKSYKRDVSIVDRKTKLNILYTEGKRVNRIDIY